MIEQNVLHLVPYPEKVVRREGICRLGDGEIRRTESDRFGEEGYELKLSEKALTMEGSAKGLLYAQTTLEQLRLQFRDAIPCMEITDRPRFMHRGWMLDSSRHFLPEEDVCKLIDAAAYFKLNRMHWHLADDQGWRVEIRRYPKLTEIGSQREIAHFGDIQEPEEQGGYFTQEQVRRIVAYAKARGIEVIPEIEIPGHESAMLAAYPEYACAVEGENGQREPIDGPFKVETRGGIFENLVCAGREETFTFLTNILDEIMELFPYPVVHIGGDEACKSHWRACPDCQKKIKELGLKDENALQQWLVVQIGEYLKQKGRSAVVWNESLRGDKLPTNFIAQAWMGDHALLADFAKRGGRIIQSSNAYYYLDYPYYLIDAKKILEAELLPDYLSNEEQKAIIGLECPLWSERIPTLERAGYLLYPRLPAMAETAWTQEGARQNATFAERYYANEKKLRQIGITPAPRDHFALSRQEAQADKEAYEKMIYTPQNKAAIDHDNALVEEEERLYAVQK
ncbi:MAG: beta-N-acetylhexosaminidase [Eubacteriales bacterium]|nr:beta-N-acetylhexosaminidase [Eubacteriales bacterium]